MPRHWAKLQGYRDETDLGHTLNCFTLDEDGVIGNRDESFKSFPKISLPPSVLCDSALINFFLL